MNIERGKMALKLLIAEVGLATLVASSQEQISAQNVLTHPDLSEMNFQFDCTRSSSIGLFFITRTISDINWAIYVEDSRTLQSARMFYGVASRFDIGDNFKERVIREAGDLDGGRVRFEPGVDYNVILREARQVSTPENPNQIVAGPELSRITLRTPSCQP